MLDFTLLVMLSMARSIHGICPPGAQSCSASYITTSVPTASSSNFSYTGTAGPLGWTGLNTANAACSISGYQSPINLDDTVGHPLRRPDINVTIPDVQYARLENMGTTLQVFVNGTTYVEEKEYKLSQFHFHTPSEHRIEEEYFPLEMHFVHQANDGSRLVLAFLFELTEDGDITELLTAVTKNLATVAVRGNTAETAPLVFQPLIRHLQTTSLYKYTGSLTTPPCADGVTWLVTREPLPLDVRTFLGLKRIMKFNARFTQGKLGDENLIVLAARQMPLHFSTTSDLL